MLLSHSRAEQEDEAVTTEAVVTGVTKDIAEAVMISFLDLWPCVYHICLLNLLSKFIIG